MGEVNRGYKKNTNNKITDLNLTISIITLIVNGLNIAITMLDRIE